MEEGFRQKIVIIGCGNVAWHLAKQFKSFENCNVTIYNHQPNSLLVDFKKKLKCRTESSIENVTPAADFYFICVADKAIRSVAERLTITNPQALLIHTSGSASLKELGSRIYGTAVMYPLQSFSRIDIIDWNKVPLITEAADEATRAKINKLASLFSDKVIAMSESDRIYLHLAAVFANNFSNAMYAAAEDILRKNTKEARFELLLPLIEKSSDKLKKISPLAAQTGPAKRGDTKTIKNHMRLLRKNEDLRKIYKKISSLIDTQQNGRTT